MRFWIEFKVALSIALKASPTQPHKKSPIEVQIRMNFHQSFLEDIFTLIKNEFSLNMRSIKSSFIITYFPYKIITVQINFHHLHGSCVGVKSLYMCVGMCVVLCKSSSHFPYYSNFIMLIIKKFLFL